MSMSTVTAITELNRGHKLQCVTPDGVRFEIQPKISDGLLWLRTRPVQAGCMNRYARLTTSELTNWLDAITIEEARA